MHAVVTGSRLLRFHDGSPVRSASAIARFGAGWLIAQDDATAAALVGATDPSDRCGCSHRSRATTSSARPTGRSA